LLKNPVLECGFATSPLLLWFLYQAEVLLVLFAINTFQLLGAVRRLYFSKNFCMAV
jgi:hypothetical protein